MTTFAQAIAAKGIDEHAEFRNLRRRARYHERLDRPKVFPADKECLSISWRKAEVEKDEAALVTLKATQDAVEYVRAWCVLNRLAL